MDTTPTGHGQTADEPLEELERQVEQGGLFTHTALSETAERVTEVETVLYGLVDLLLEQGIVDTEALGQAANLVRHQLEDSGETSSPGIALRVDGEVATRGAVVVVNCSARVHICHAVCCRLRFALSAEEVESGVVKWDLGKPYQIRHDPNGRCVHNEADTRGCTVYETRPTVCRGYSCAGDERIWSDFEAMQLNTEWIQENLGEARPQLTKATMVRLDEPRLRPGADPPAPTVSPPTR
jgi:Fe-S-cluster containining protein